jgi:ribosome biogenesis GTPase / thiamine phosphate phosphatase
MGWSDALQEQFEQLCSTQLEATLQPARVVAEHRGAYELFTSAGPRWAEPTGRLRRQASDRLDMPAVGDWVALDAEGRVVAVVPRKSAFVRKVAWERTEPQVVAANIDTVFIVTSANSDFNPRRIERYLSAVRDGGAAPVLVINKTDLCQDIEGLVASLGGAAHGLTVARVSALERSGGDQLACHIGPRLTVALVGSSGVGKSTIANWLLGKDTLETAEISENERGRHTTTHRELIPLPGGGALIDTPGMRELTLWADADDLAGTFGDIEELASGCRFIDCQHEGQPGCAIAAAIERGELEAARFQNFLKLQRELLYQEQRKQQAADPKQGKAKQIARAMRQRRKGPLGGKLR